MGRLTLIWTGGGAILLAGLVTVTLSFRVSSAYAALDQHLDSDLLLLISEISPALAAPDPAAALESSPVVATVAFAVRDHAGFRLFRSPSFPPLDRAAERDATEAVQHRRRWTTVRTADGTPIRLATAMIENRQPPIAIQTVSPEAGLRHELAVTAAWLLATFTLALGMLAVVGYRLSARVVAPWRRLATALERVDRDDAAERLPTDTGSPEADRLAADVNRLLDRLQISLRSARRFVADASHELQTPLAVMRSATESCLRDDVPVTCRHRAIDLVTEIDHVSALVRDLRLLALADAGRLVERWEAVSLASVVNECADIGRALAEDKQIRVDTTVDARAVVTGSALHLRRMLLNLVQNAIRYSPAGSLVRIALADAGGDAVIRVEDEGEGIPPHAVPHIFEPFYRLEPDRSRDTGGTGLGLPIAEQIVRAHRGRITVESVVGEGTVFEVRLPLASAARERAPATASLPA